MKLFGVEFGWAEKAAAGTIDINTLMKRIDALYDTAASVQVTPENCMQSPTVQAIVNAVSRRMATLPIQIFQKTTGSNGRISKELLPSHPVARLLNQPNDWQTRTSYLLDATSWLMRYGNFYAFKSRGKTGPIRLLTPLMPYATTIEQDDEDLSISFKTRMKGGKERVFDPSEIHHVRSGARDGLKGDSPIMDVREAIALEIAAERMGGSFLGNGAMPSLVFQYQQGSQGHKTDEERKRFTTDFDAAYAAKRGRFKSMLLPKGVELADPIMLENEKAQFLETRQYQRTVIAGAFGVPPHLVGDLTKMTFGNVEQQSLDFIQSVVLPYCQMFESAMERDLLTKEDRAGGVILRFNVDAALRGDFKSRQEGLNIQRTAGVISANDWRERENMNPIGDEDGGDEYWRKGPSGQSADPAAEPTETEPKPEDPANSNEKGATVHAIRAA
jgi:HK97 family phage portal protein